MSNRIRHSLLTLLFVLLQCVSPLVHAHVEGEQSGLLHLPGLAVVDAALSACATVDADGPIIELSDDLHRQAPAAASPVPSMTVLWNPGVTFPQRMPVPVVIGTVLHADHRSPPPQAPPVLF